MFQVQNYVSRKLNMKLDIYRAYTRHLLCVVLACNECHFDFFLCNFYKPKTCVLFMEISSLICSKFTKICPLLFITQWHVRPAILKYALIKNIKIISII